MTSMINEAEQKLVNQAVFLRDLLEALRMLERVGNRYITLDRHRMEYEQAYQKIRDVIYREHIERESRLTGFLALGGEEAKEYSLAEFRKMYGENAKDMYSLSHFLSDYGVTSWYREDDDKALRDALKEELR
jgi:hypothetical protein